MTPRLLPVAFCNSALQLWAVPIRQRLSPVSEPQCRSRGRVDRRLDFRPDRQPGPRHAALRTSALGSAEAGTPREEGGKEGAQPQRRRSLGKELLEKADQAADEDAFSFPLAVLLAGCAFEAYKEPVAGPGESSPFQYCERAVNGTQTVYVDRWASTTCKP